MQLVNKLTIVSDITKENISEYIHQLRNNGVKLEMFPEHSSLSFPRSHCIFSFLSEPPKEAIEFLKKNISNNIHLVCTSEAAQFIDNDILARFPLAIILDNTITVLKKVHDHLQCLIEILEQNQGG